MGLQLYLGASGSDASVRLHNMIISESITNPHTNYIILVPEQYSMQLQREMVKIHPNKGSMNIDVIGFNRLAYRIFDEQHYKPAKILEDFGKSMLIRLAASEVQDELVMYKSSLDKTGFIDEAKSLMSELYQYDISFDELMSASNSLDDDSLILKNKIADMCRIFKKFEQKLSDNYIVDEGITELLSERIVSSKLISNSVIVLEGFTGFTPIQMKVIEKLMRISKDMKCLFTIDKDSFYKNVVEPHELFYLTRITLDDLKHIALKNSVHFEEEIFGEENVLPDELEHLERNIFRYPYEKYNNKNQRITIKQYNNPKHELEHVACEIRALVKNGLRYKDIAVVTGALEESISQVDRVFPKYDIPFFLDYSRPLKNNPFINAIQNAIRIVDENFSYDSVFSFLKTGVFTELSYEEIEELENYVISRGIRGYSWWSKSWTEEITEIKNVFVDLVSDFYMSMIGKKNCISNYVSAIYSLMDKLAFETQIEKRAYYCEELGELQEAKVYHSLYSNICFLLDKMNEIIADEKVDVNTFYDLVYVGLKDISLGIIPTSLDMVTIGDITRTRLGDIKVLFIIELNDGIIPKQGSSASIIGDKDKERLLKHGVMLAPTDRQNSFIEQLYLYLCLTKPTEKLNLSFVKQKNDSLPIRQSYIISRIKNIFPNLEIKQITAQAGVCTLRSSVECLSDGMIEILQGNSTNYSKMADLYRLYRDENKTDVIEKIFSALKYSNVPQSLSQSVNELIKARLMYQSVSKLERFANCEYSYYLRYTLGLSERSEKTIDNRDIGIILHSAMEKIYKHVHDNRNNEWENVDDKTKDELVEKYVNESFVERYEEEDVNDKKFIYLKDTLIRIGKRSVSTLAKISSSDSLRPELFEFKFKKEINLNEDFSMVLNGIVDRGDIYCSEDGKSERIRIIDYKTGNKTFKLNELYEGLELQLAVYMNAIIELRRDRNSHFHKDIKVKSDGMYFYQLQDPFINANINTLEKEREKKLRLCGIEDDGSDNIEIITDFAVQKVKNLAGEILNGEISKNPIKHGQKNACQYCDYKQICRFDTKYGGNTYRYVRFKDGEKDMVMDAIKRETGRMTDETN